MIERMPPLVLYHLMPSELKDSVLFKPSSMGDGLPLDFDDTTAPQTVHAHVNRHVTQEEHSLRQGHIPKYLYFKKATRDMDIAANLQHVMTMDFRDVLDYTRVILSESFTDMTSISSVKYIHFIHHITPMDPMSDLDIGMHPHKTLKCLDHDAVEDNALTVFDMILYLKRMFHRKDDLVLSDISQHTQRMVIKALPHLDEGEIGVLSHAIGSCEAIMTCAQTPIIEKG